MCERFKQKGNGDVRYWRTSAQEIRSPLRGFFASLFALMSSIPLHSLFEGGILLANCSGKRYDGGVGEIVRFSDTAEPSRQAT